MSRPMRRLPSLRHPSRRGPLVRLLAAGLARGALAGLTVALFLRAEADALPALTLAGSLVAVAAGLALLRAVETREAERLGQRYVHSLRRRLLRVVHAHPEAVRARFGRGSLWLRLSGDLNGLRRWISQGLARGLAAALMLAGLLLALLLLASPLAWVALALVGVQGLAVGLATAPLRQREQALRRARARLANAVERSLAAATTAAEDSAGTQGRVRRRSEAVVEGSLSRADVHAAVRAVAEFAPLAAVGISLALAAAQGPGLLSTLALVSLMAAPLRELGLAWEMRQSYRVAADKVQALLRLAGPDPGPDPDSDAAPEPVDALPLPRPAVAGRSLVPPSLSIEK